MLQIYSKRECEIEIDGQVYILPVRPRTTTTSIILSELYDKRKKIVEDLMAINKRLAPLQEKIESMQSDSRDLDSLSADEKKVIEKDLKEVEKLQVDMQKQNKILDSVINNFYRAIIIDYDTHKNVVENIPIEDTWLFIEELIAAMTEPAKKKVMNLIGQTPSIESNGKSDSDQPDLLKPN